MNNAAAWLSPRGILVCALTVALAGCDDGEVTVARDRMGRITESEALALLDEPAAWAENLADAVGLDETATQDPVQRVAAAKYLSVARQLLAASDAAQLEANARAQSEFERANVELQLLLLEEQIRRRVTDISRQDIERYYQQNHEDYAEPPTRTLRQLFLHVGPLPDGSWRSRHETLRVAEQARWAVAAGAPFQALVAVASESMGGGSDGLVGPVERGALRWEVDDVLWAMEPGEISGVIESGSGIHLIHMLSEQPERIRPLEEVEDEIVPLVIAERMEEEENRLQDLVGEKMWLEYYPEHAELPADATAVVLRLGSRRYTRAECEQWLLELTPEEQELYRTPERRAAFVRERCTRLIRLAAVKVLGIDRSPAFQHRLRQAVDALRLSLLLDGRLAQLRRNDPNATHAMVVAQLLRENGFKAAPQRLRRDN